MTTTGIENWVNTYASRRVERTPDERIAAAAGILGADPSDPRLWDMLETISDRRRDELVAAFQAARD